MHIRYSVVDYPLGRMLVAATSQGVCMVSLGDDDDALRAGLAAEYPSASIEPNSIVSRQWIDGIVAYLDGQPPQPDLPLDLRGTAFQWKVWRALQAIPYGSTRTYQQLAREHIGNVGAARAVARACAANPVALVIPCHRVLRSDGGLGGYRWGVERKRCLISREVAHRSTSVDEAMV